MNILRDVGSGLGKMFVGDAWLTAGVLIVVALTALLIELVGAPPLAGGAVLFVGCVTLLWVSVAVHARQHGGSRLPPDRRRSG